MKKPVKLYVYSFESETRTSIGIEEAEEFEDFVLVSINSSTMNNKNIESLQDQLTEMFPDKRLLIFDKSLDIAIYGVKEFDEHKSPEDSCQLTLW